MNGNCGWENSYKIPAFGNWDYEYDHHDHDYDDLSYTQRFENARQAGLVRYGSYPQASEERDLYVAGDLYQNDVVTPAFIVVPHPSTRGKRGLGYPNVKEQGKKQQGKRMQQWGGYSYSYDIKIKKGPGPGPIFSPPIKAKAVDEDLYKISSEFIHVKSKRKRSTLGFFSSCLLPACV
uniref:Uncharacterized protein n=1 Tax=Opuntia streptacantha TaxID=393608 RepID=A0A7C8ZG02_OPUST